MIPDFKTYVCESVWGDIRKRGLGDEIKAEDSINHLDRDGLYEYLINNYKTDKWYNQIQNSSEQDFITIPVFYWHGGDAYNLCYNFENNKINKIVITHDLPQMSICSSLKKFFTITEHEITWCIITPKDGSEVNNQFCIDVLDCLISCCLKKSYKLAIEKINLDESVWGDIRKRGLGDEIKAEDNVDHFDYEEFFVYLTELYQPKSKKINEKIGGRTSVIDTDLVEIFIPIESIDGRIKTLIIEMSKKDNSVISMATSPTLFDKYVNLERMLSNNYTLTTSRFGSRIYLKPKKNPTNKTIMDLIDTFLVVVDNPILEKIS